MSSMSNASPLDPKCIVQPLYPSRVVQMPSSSSTNFRALIVCTCWEDEIQISFAAYLADAPNCLALGPSTVRLRVVHNPLHPVLAYHNVRPSKQENSFSSTTVRHPYH